MNIYELEKQTTPTPLEVHETPGRMDYVTRTLRSATPFNNHGGKRYVIGIWQTVSTDGTVDNGVTMSEVDAKMLCHCRNNYLRALELATEYLNMLYRHALDDEDIRQVEATIKELEEVE